MSRTPRHIFLPALLVATLAATAAAQQDKPIANWVNLNQLVTGAEIRAVGGGGGLAVGAVEVSRTRPGAMFRNLGYAVFPPLGALVGTVIGVALPTGGWRDVYRAP